MPRSTREYLLRYADEALNDMDRVLYNLMRISEMYGDIHPEYRDAFQLIAQNQVACQEALKLLRTEVM